MNIIKPLNRRHHYVAYFCDSIYFYKDETATQHPFLQRSCYIFVDKCIALYKKQRTSCDILAC